MGSWTPGPTPQAQRYGAPWIRAYNMLRPELSHLASTMRRFHPYSTMGNGPLIGPQERVVRGRQLIEERMMSHASPGPSTRRVLEGHPGASMRGAAGGLPPTPVMTGVVGRSSPGPVCVHCRRHGHREMDCPLLRR